MPQPEFEWRLEDAPADDEPAPPSSPAPAPTTRPDRRRRWRPLLIWLSLLAALGLGVYAYQRLGWQRLRAQVVDEIAYEDERSNAQDQMAVLSIQAVDQPTWRSQRRAEAAAGLAAPLPAPHLAPASTAPRLLQLDTAGGDVFSATVRREYVDAAGQVYAFDLTQRYRNVGAGLWQRLPPEPQAAREGWEGEWLSADSLPAGEEALWQELLPQVDALVTQACTAWACLPSSALRLRIEGWPVALDPPRLPAWAAASGRTVAYPATFDVLDAVPTLPTSGPVLVPALSLTGLPAGASERQALVHALTLRALYAIAGRHTLISGPAGDPYLAAFIARAEAHLGLASAVVTPPLPPSLLTPDVLWQARTLQRTGPPRPPVAASLEGRLLVLDFLNQALRGQPPTADGPLLRTLLRNQTLNAWLNSGLGVGQAEAALTGWADALSAHLTQQSGLPAPDATGLHYVCGDPFALQRVTAAGSQILSDQDPPGGFGGFGVAVSERYVAYLTGDDFEQMDLVMIDTAAGSARTIAAGRPFTLLGWSAAGQLLYLDGQPFEDGTLVRYDPATDRHEPLLDDVTASFQSIFPSWSADRTWIGLNLTRPGSTTAPLAMHVVDPVQGQALAEQGSGTWIAPDGHAAAYQRFGEAGTSAFQPGDDIHVTVVSLAAPAQTLAQARHPSNDNLQGGFMTWTPDSQALLYAAGTDDGQVRPFLLALDGSLPRPLAIDPVSEASDVIFAIGFSADGQYLALVGLGDSGVTEVVVMAWPDGPTRHYSPAEGLVGLAWSSTGHTLALPTLGGLFLTDAATGAARWLTLSPCVAATW